MAVRRISSGTAQCHDTPTNGKHGLEGYLNGQTYRFVRLIGDKGEFMRLYPDALLPESERVNPLYHESCSVGVFRQHFTIVTENPE